MTQLTRLSLLVTVCFLVTVGVAQVTPSGNATSSATPHGNATSSAKHGNAKSTKVVVLQCTGDNGSLNIQVKPKPPDTVIFATPASCPLTSFDFVNHGQNAPGFTFEGTDLDGNYVYAFDETQMPLTGYQFKYITDGHMTGGNGTGVIK